MLYEVITLTKDMQNLQGFRDMTSGDHPHIQFALMNFLLNGSRAFT